MDARTPSAPLGWSVAVALLAGVCVVQGVARLPPLPASAAAAALTAWMWLRGGRWRLAAAFGFGIAWACLQAGAFVAVQASLHSGADTTVTGHVLGLPQRDARATRFELQVDGPAENALAGRVIRLAWYGRLPPVAPGSRWRLSVRLRPPEGPINPGGFDAARQALAQGIVAVGYVRNGPQLRPLTPGRGLDFWRDRLSMRIAAALPDRRGRYVQALAIGDTRGLDARDWETLRTVGLTHQIAISGFHVGMVAGLGSLLVVLAFRLLPVLGRGWPRPQAAALGGLVVASGYAALAGFSLPTVRTLLMIAVMLGARLLRRGLGGADAVALALVAVLLFDSAAVLAPGFWLSFLGVAWLLWCLPSETGQGVLRPFLKAQAVAVIGLLPLTVWFFGQASVIGPLTNLVGIPVISLAVVPLSLLGLLALSVSEPAATLAWQGAAGLVDALWQGLEWASRWPGALRWLPEPSLLAVALALSAAFWLTLPRGVPGKYLAACLLLPLLWPSSGAPAVGEADIAVMDVGQGTAVLVRTHAHALLYGVGPNGARAADAGDTVVVPALRAVGVRRLDAVILIDGDADDAGGLVAVRRAFPRAQLVAPEGWAPPGATWCRAGVHWRWDGVSFRFLHPPRYFPYLHGNSACVLRIEAGGHVALLPGDIAGEVEGRLADAQAPWLRADWLLVPRRGERSASSPAFVSAVSPRWAVISRAAGHRRHPPDPGVLARYRRRGAVVADTSESGWMRFRLGADGLDLLEARRATQARYWRAAP